MKSMLMVALLSLAAGFAHAFTTNLVTELKESGVRSYKCGININYLKINESTQTADVVKRDIIWVDVLSDSRGGVELKCLNKFNPEYNSLVVDGVERVMLSRYKNENLFTGMDKEIKHADISAIYVGR